MKLESIGAGIASVAANAGKGALAGALATAVMTLSSTIEMKLGGREASSVPAKAAGKVLGVQPRDPAGSARFGEVVHWSYGTAWGGVGGVLRTALPEPMATMAHFASVWGTEATILPGLDVAPPLTEWGAKVIAIDVFHHLVYVGAFAGAWYLLEKSEDRDSLLEMIRERVA